MVMRLQKIFRTNLRRILLCVCALLMVCGTASMSISAENGPAGTETAENEQPPDGYDSWEDYYNSLIYGDQADEVEVPPLEDMTRASENEAFILYFHEEGLDFYITDKRTGKLWSTAVHPEYMDVSQKKPEEYSTLLEILLADNENGISQHALTDQNTAGFQVDSRMEDHGVILHISMPEAGVAFDFCLRLTAEGFSASIPEDSIAESGEKRLLSVAVLPRFGVAAAGEDGYIFYPDGEGALIDIKPYPPPLPQSCAYPLYGMSDPDVDDFLLREKQDIKNLMLPVFGIKHTNGGFLAAAEQGDADATLMIEITDSYSAWFRFDYRRYISADFNYSGTAKGGGKITRLLDKRIEGDKEAQYFLLAGERCTYSDMAATYRDWLEEKGTLTRQQSRDAIPLSVAFFMAVSKNSIFGSRLETLTTYRQAGNILSDLSGAGVASMQALLTGWSAGGYEAMPTPPKPAGALGGSGGFNALVNICQDNRVMLFADCEYLLGDRKHGKFNTKKDILRDLLGTAVTGKGSDLMFLNAVKSLPKNVAAAAQKSGGAWQISLTDMGTLALPNFYDKDVRHRTDTVNAYRAAMEMLKTHQSTVSVSGGNAYVLPYAGRLYEIPDSDSLYIQNSRAVPFYQMVAHGYLDYTSVAGNMSESEQIQKLRWIETGSLPHYLLTEKSPVALRGTGYNRIFSSEYKQWKRSLLAVYEEFNERLLPVWDQRMVRHEQKDGDLVCITYENGMKTYINYALEPREADGIRVPAEDYVVVSHEIRSVF